MPKSLSIHELHPHMNPRSKYHLHCTDMKLRLKEVIKLKLMETKIPAQES